ncbi:hypothetical protein RB5088 [Rhodopirellula baltica SH 1]|uniref:Uncharacterized protein n=1 Tax=Rhodopirellula baltica (strain DSM 10527 / NCIMB 13988 / SH1) TaxID=243090 RepID=Q7UGQ0_RHOBA|nr:hypothetical protein RB5088 [Rhodopirellula baltica SH 1]
MNEKCGAAPCTTPEKTKDFVSDQREGVGLIFGQDFSAKCKLSWISCPKLPGVDSLSA